VTCFPAPTADDGQLIEHMAASTDRSRNAVSEIVVGCLNIRSLLNKYDAVRTVSRRAALKRSGEAGETRGMPWRWATPCSQACYL